MEENQEQDLTPSKSDWTHTLAKAGISAIPIIGGPAAELLGALMVPPLAKRRDEWLKSIAEGLKELERKVDGFTIESLVGNDIFVSAVMHASLVALRNHQQEKIEVLRNAVLNVACGRAPHEDLQLMFLHMIDSFTPWHIRLLAYFNDPVTFTKARHITYDREWPSSVHVMRDAFPELKSRAYIEDLPFFRLALKDLYAYGLIFSESGELYDVYDSKRVRRKSTTEIGDSFLSFISCPPQ